MLSTFCTFRIASSTKKKTKSFNLTPVYFVVKFHEFLNINKFVCIITSDNNKTMLTFSFL